MAKAPDEPQFHTLKDGADDVGWVFGIFVSLAGAPPVLSILQSIFADLDLTPLFQWIVNGYDTAMAAVGGVIEPLFQPLLDWISQQLHWSLEIRPYWRPLFAIAVIFVLAIVRASWRNNERIMAVLIAAVFLPFALMGALGVGLVPLDGSWWMQGVAATVPGFLVILPLSFIMLGDRESRGLALVLLLLPGIILFATGAGLAFIPGLAFGAGILALCIWVFLFGCVMLLFWFAVRSPLVLRIGLTLVGGFAVALGILAADAALRSLAFSGAS